MASDFIPGTPILERSESGIHVFILWNAADDKITLVLREGENESFSADIPSDSVLDAFAHPYCYLSKDDIEISRSRRRELVLA